MRVLCPYCKKPSQIRTAKKMTNKIVYRYHQCINIACGCSFKSETVITGIIRHPLDCSGLTDSDTETLIGQHKHINQKALTKSTEGEVEPI